MTNRWRRHAPAGVAALFALVGTALVAINIAALTLGWKHPEVLVPAIALDAFGLGLAFWMAWRQSMKAEAAYQGLSAERERETQRIQAGLEATLADTKARYGAIIESAMDAVITVDEAQRIVLFNHAAEIMFGTSRAQAIGGSLDRFLPERFRASHAAHIAAFGTAGVTNRRMGHNTVLAALRADGTEFPIEASISKAGADDGQLYTVILRDITRRVQSDEAIRRSQAELRELSAQVLQAREDEKTRFARELHDELGQQLTALKMDLSWARERLPEGAADLADKLTRMNSTLDATVTATRRISADLRPLMLDDLGLAAAAEWLVDDFQARTGIDCDLEIRDPDSLSSLEPAIATGLYRMLQESLTNITRHAGAKHARVSLDIADGEALLVVDDDGRGINSDDQAKARSFGLKGMRERAHYLGGVSEVGRREEGGTRVCVRVPVRNGAAA